MKKYIFYCLINLIIIQLLGLIFPPFGFILGSTLILPFIILYLGEKNLIQRNRILLTILILYIISRTLDWFYAPGTHDTTGVAFMIIMSIIATILITGIWVYYILQKKLNTKKRLTYLILIAILSIPFLHILCLKNYFNEHLNTTKKDFYEFIK